MTHVGDDGEVRQGLQDVEPGADVLRALGHRPPVLTHKLVCVQTHLGPVVEQSEERGQWEGRHEDGDEPELQHWESQHKPMSSISYNTTEIQFKY